MTDPTVCQLVRQVVRDRDLSAVAPLIDRLEELGDFRRNYVVRAAGNMARACADALDRPPFPGAGADPAYAAYRQAGQRRNALAALCQPLEAHFWLELTDLPLAESLRRCAEFIRPESLDADLEAAQLAYEEWSGATVQGMPPPDGEVDYAPPREASADAD